nr:hypothetical protein [Tanacetum cinerariifolium]
MQKNLALIAKYFKKIYKPTNNNLRTSSNSWNKNVDTTPRYKNDNHSGHCGNQRMLNVAGDRENVGSPVQNEAGYNVFADDIQHSEQSESQEMHADLKYVESLEKEIDELESDKAEFSNMYDMILQECVSKYVMCSYLLLLSDLDALDELQCLYLHKVKECDCLAQKLSKQTESVKHDTVWNEKASNVFRKEREQYFKIQDLKAQLQDKNIAISELKKLIEKGKGKSMDTKFDKPSVVRQPNAQRIPKPSVLGKPSPFSNSLERIYFSKTKSVPKTNVSEGLSKPVTAKTLPQTARQAVRNTNVLKLGMYRINNRSTQTRAPQLTQTIRNINSRVSTSTGVNHKTNVSRPQHKSNQLKDKFLPNNSQVKPKKTQVELQPRIPSVSNKMKSVTACKDNLNYRTLNANAVCATCNKCLVDSNHYACITKMLNDVNARTKKHNVVPISTRKPKGQANKSVATSHNKKVASKLTNQKPHSYFRMLYEKTSKTWKWWIEQWKQILKKQTKTREKTTKPNTKWKRSKKTKSIEAGSQKSKPVVNKSQLKINRSRKSKVKARGQQKSTLKSQNQPWESQSQP